VCRYGGRRERPPEKRRAGRSRMAEKMLSRSNLLPRATTRQE